MANNEPNLIGLQLPNGWILEAHTPHHSTTGGHCSLSYRACNHDECEAFVKVLDIRPALESDDFSATLKPLIDAFEFEKQLLQDCQDIKRVVTAIDSGQINVNGLPIQYLVFKLADGDARQQRRLINRFDGAWSMRTLHHVSAALEQLHHRGIAHQDIKPSNILVFAHGDTKIGDLGRSCRQDRVGPHDGDEFPGDARYAPPEYGYGYCPSSWRQRRNATDLYLLGSLACFLLTGASMTELIATYRDESHSPSVWTEPYAGVVPFLLNAQTQALDALRNEYKDDLDPRVSDRLWSAIQWLCHPDPAKRGHPRAHAQNAPYNLRRFVALFDLLANWQERYFRIIASR